MALAGAGPVLAFGEWVIPAFLWLVLGLTGFFFERGRAAHPPDWITRHLIALPILAFALLDVFERGTALMPAIAHMLCLLAVAKSVKKKAPGDLWTMFFLSLLLMLVGAVIALHVLYFALWIAWSMAGIAFLNAALLVPRGDATVGVHAPPGVSVVGRWLRLSSTLWIVVTICAGFSFFFFPRDLSQVRAALNMRRNTDRLAWNAGIMIPEGRQQTVSGFSENLDIGSLASAVLDGTEALELRMTRDGQPWRAPADEIYLRGRAFEKFDGRRWTTWGKPEDWEDAGRYSDGPRWLERRTDFRVSVDVRPTGEKSPIMFLPRPVTEVRVPAYYRNPAGDLKHIAGPAPTFATAHWKPWGAPGFSRASALWHPNWTELTSSPHEAEYDALAERITQGLGRNVHERATAISRWLSENCEYTLQLEWQSNADPVHEFLTRRRGYCVYFATAMAVLLRSIRIPCRVVVGYAGGEWDEQRRCQVFRKSDAHAWVEIPYGTPGNVLWVPYDPTAGARIAQPRELATAPGWWGSLRGTLDRNLLFYDAGRQRDLIQSIGGFVRVGLTTVTGWAAIAAGLALFAWYARVAAKKRAKVEELLRSRGLVPIATWPSIAWYGEMLLALRRIGIERPANVTPREFVGRVAAQDETLEAPVATITELFEQEKYGQRRADASKARQALAELKKVVSSQ
jgi:transglutaminase-like putative cysteine protease